MSEEQLSRAVSAEVRRLLEERGMSGNQLAKASGVPQVNIARKLRGDRAFDLDELAAIGPALGVKVADIIEWAQRS